MVGAVLGVVLDDEDRRRRPERRPAHRLDEPAEGEVVLRHEGGGGELAGARAAGVIVGEADDLQPRHLPLGLEAGQLGDEAIGPFQVGVVLIEAAEVRVDSPLERRHLRRAGVVGGLAVGHPLAVAADAHPGGDGPIPEVAAGGAGRGVEAPFARVGELLPPVVAVGEGPVPLDEVGGVGPHAPFVAVGADLALDVEVVEEDELPRQGMVVRRDALGKEAERRVAVPLRHVAEDLVVGAVLLDHVDHVLDRALRPGGERDRMTVELLFREEILGPRRPAGEGLFRPLGHLRGEAVVGGEVDERHRAVEQAADVVGGGGVGIEAGPRAVAVGLGDHPLAVGDEEPRAVGGEPHRRRIPAHGDETEAAGAARLLHLPHADGVDHGVGDEEPLTVGGDRQGVGHVAGGSVGRERGHESLGDTVSVEIDHRDAVAVGVGDEEPLPVGREEHLVGVLLHLDPSRHFPLPRVDHRHRRLGPERDVEPPARLVDDAGPGVGGVGDDAFEEHVGPLGDRGIVGGLGRLRGRRRGGVGEEQFVHHRLAAVLGQPDPRHGMAPDVRGVERPAAVGHGDAAGDAADLLVAEGHRAVGHERGGDEAEAEERLGGAARGPERRAIGGEGEPLERLLEPGPRKHAPRLDVDHRDLVRPEAAVEHRGVAAVGMDRDVRGEVPHFHLSPRRPQ